MLRTYVATAKCPKPAGTTGGPHDRLDRSPQFTLRTTDEAFTKRSRGRAAGRICDCSVYRVTRWGMDSRTRRPTVSCSGCCNDPDLAAVQVAELQDMRGATALQPASAQPVVTSASPLASALPGMMSGSVLITIGAVLCGGGLGISVTGIGACVGIPAFLVGICLLIPGIVLRTKARDRMTNQVIAQSVAASVARAVPPALDQLRCSSCNSPLQPGATFCSSCGTRVT
jgi:hypothetical protein